MTATVISIKRQVVPRTNVAAVAYGLSYLDRDLTAFDCVAGAMVMIEQIKKCGYDVVPVVGFRATPIDQHPAT